MNFVRGLSKNKGPQELCYCQQPGAPIRDSTPLHMRITGAAFRSGLELPDRRYWAWIRLAAARCEAKGVLF